MAQAPTPHSSSQAPIRLMVVDDHQSVRQGLISLLAAYSQNIQVVAEAQNADEALMHAEHALPDIVLTDLQMKPTGGIQLVQQLRQRQPQIRYVVFTASEEPEPMLQAYAAAVQGFVCKGTDISEIVRAIESVMAGSTHYPAGLKQALDRQSQQPVLTEREKEVLHYVGKGMTGKEIGRILHIDHRTVDTHKGNIRQRFNLDSSAALIRFAILHSE
ncbi:MAG: response regulator transcription factor [Pseudomonadota bacterium]